VIKVERPGSGDFARGYDQRVNGQSSHFTWINRSKESLALDVKQPQAKQALMPAGSADVLVQNLAPGAAARMGLSYEALKAHNPAHRLRHQRLRRRRPYRDKKAYDLLIQSEAGFLSVTGTPETPSKAGISVADIAAGMYAYTNILSALLLRGARARAATSTCPCSKPWASGWATRCTTPSTARRRRRAPAHRTPASTPTAPSRPGTAAR
jgi:crotonobetainyl-CoA:carnitine CoA-transferase CaiB-like acyl-CoA transferase